MTHDNVTDIMERLQDVCLDWDGSQMKDAEEPRNWLSVGEIREAADTIATLRKQLENAREALREYACHAGPSAPCRRPPHQCEQECGKIAGDAFTSIDEALKGEK